MLNTGTNSVEFSCQGIEYTQLSVMNGEKRALRALPSWEPAVQRIFRTERIPPGETVVLAYVDLDVHYGITQPGNYFVQFDEYRLKIGRQVPHWSPGPFGEDDGKVRDPSGFLEATNRFPSEVVMINVKGRE